MSNNTYYQNLISYYLKSKLIFDIFLYGAKHLGFYPEGQRISEKKAQQLMHDLIAEKINLTENQIILDAGCGQGVVSVYLSKRYNCNIYGVSIVPFEIKRAKTLAKRKKISDKTNYYLMDYNKLEFEKEFFDSIYTIESFVHSINIEITLKEFYRVLKKNGKITLFEYAIDKKEHYSQYEQEILKKVCDKAAMAGLHEINYTSFIELMKKIGFKNINVENININVAPSVYRLRKLFRIPYFFVRVFRQQQNFPNLTGVIEFSEMGEKDLLKYSIFTAEK